MTEPFDVKGITARIGMSEDDWYKRTGGRQTPFTIEEAGRVAEMLDAPPCWPFDEWRALETRYPEWRWKGVGIKAWRPPQPRKKRS